MTEKQILRKLARLDDQIEVRKSQIKAFQEEKLNLRADLKERKKANAPIRGKRLSGSPGGMSAHMPTTSASCSSYNV